MRAAGRQDPGPRRCGARKSRGFSLVEVTVALGLVATALLPLIAMMALAVSNQREANEESIAMMISQGIFADLRKSTGKDGVLVRVGSSFPETSNDPNADYRRISGTEFCIVYGMDPDWAGIAGAGGGADIDRGVKPLRADASCTEYTSGTASADTMDDVLSTHIAKISILPAPTGSGGHEPASLKMVVVSVEVPSVASAPNRRKYVFSSLMTLTDRF